MEAINIGTVLIPKDNIALVVTDGDGIKVYLRRGQKDVLNIAGMTVEGFESLYNGSPY